MIYYNFYNILMIAKKIVFMVWIFLFFSGLTSCVVMYSDEDQLKSSHFWGSDNFMIESSSLFWLFYEAVIQWFTDLDYRTKFLLFLIVWLFLNIWGIHIAWKKYHIQLNNLSNIKPSKTKVFFSIFFQ